MALVKCTECGHEISTEAKTCPNCGAKNKNRIRKHRVWPWVLVIIIALAVFLIIDNENNGIPECGSDQMAKQAQSLFDTSSYAQLKKLRAIDVANQRLIRKGKKPLDQVCEVTLRISTGENQKYLISFEDNKKDGYYIKLRPK